VDAAEVIAELGLQPHAEGGWYVEIWRAVAAAGERPAGSSIFFLLREGETSHWHRLDAPEVWHFHAGSPMELRVHADGATTVHTLGTDLAAGQRPQAVVPDDAWQTARSLGPWTLVGCTMAPAFTLDGFELAPPGWDPEPAVNGTPNPP
jgi:predicted cupin superfamily sugar epimerase